MNIQCPYAPVLIVLTYGPKGSQTLLPKLPKKQKYSRIFTSMSVWECGCVHHTGCYCSYEILL